MDRRTFLRGALALAGGAGLAGCSGEGEVPETAPPPPPGVRSATAVPIEGVEDGRSGGDTGVEVGGPVDQPEGANSIVLIAQNSFAAEDGTLVVTITVANQGTTRQVALVQVTVDADETVVLERFVDLPPGEETQVRFESDVTYDAYSGHVPRILSETPATPLPTQSPTPSATATPTATATGTATGDVSPTEDGDGTDAD